MPQYTDDEIRNMKKITCKIAANYLGISTMAVTIGMKNNLLPIGFAAKSDNKYSDTWTYCIIAERLIAYKYGKITEVQIQGIESSIDKIVSEFQQMKNDLVFLLSEKEG